MNHQDTQYIMIENFVDNNPTLITCVLFLLFKSNPSGTSIQYIVICHNCNTLPLDVLAVLLGYKYTTLSTKRNGS